MTILSPKYNLMFVIAIIAVVVPTCFIASLATVYYYLGIEKLFSEQVSKSINVTVEVAKSYLDEHINSIKLDTLSIINELDDQFYQLMHNSRKFTSILDSQATAHNLSEIVIFNKERIISKTSESFALLFDSIPYDILSKADEGGIYIRRVSDDKVQAIVRLDRYIDYVMPSGIYLLIGRYLDDQIVRHLKETEDSASSYLSIHGDVQVLRTRVFTAMGIVSLLFLLGSLSLVANLVIKPVNRLVQATAKISEGNFDIRVPESKASNEITILSKAFNHMVQRIKEQHIALKEANDHLMERRRFIETILSSLSAGVIALDHSFCVVLCNDSASGILCKSELIGKYCSEVFPEVIEFLCKEKELGCLNKQNTRLDKEIFDDDSYINLNIQRKDKSISLLVKVAVLQDVYGETIIITFDDITELVKAQRFEVWADIARRVAHEIKNPLTPIQLAIELLERKFSKQILQDSDTFARYIHTIIARVEDIRQMVTSFSNFANISIPVMGVHNLIDLIQEVLVLQKVANPYIEYEFDKDLQDCYVHCDRMQVVQILTNLLKNSAESILEKCQEAKSMRDKAKFSVHDNQLPSLSNFKGLIRINIKNKGNRVIVSIYDNGQGLDNSIVDRVSEPYATTKASGTGLGLSIVKRIVKEHKGKFDIINLDQGGVLASFDLQLAEVS